MCQGLLEELYMHPFDSHNILGSYYCYHPHFSGDETKAQKYGDAGQRHKATARRAKIPIQAMRMRSPPSSLLCYMRHEQTAMPVLKNSNFKYSALHL